MTSRTPLKRIEPQMKRTADMVAMHTIVTEAHLESNRLETRLASLRAARERLMKQRVAPLTIVGPRAT